MPDSGASVPRSGSSLLRQSLRQGQRALARHLQRLPGAQATDVHQFRVACRRLRALLKSFGPFFDEEAAVDYRRRLGRVARLGGDVRELDAIALLPELQHEPFVQVLARARRVAVQKLRRRLAGKRVAMQVQAVRVGVSTRELGLVGAVPESAVLRRVRHTWRRADELLSRRPCNPQALHALRIRLKNCRYALDVVADLAPRPATVLRHRLREAQQLLGDQRDVTAAIQWLDGSKLPLPLRQAADKRLMRRERRLVRDLGRALPQLEEAGQRWERAVTRLIGRGR